MRDGRLAQPPAGVQARARGREYGAGFASQDAIDDVRGPMTAARPVI